MEHSSQYKEREREVLSHCQCNNNLLVHCWMGGLDGRSLQTIPNISFTAVSLDDQCLDDVQHCILQRPTMLTRAFCKTKALAFPCVKVSVQLAKRKSQRGKERPQSETLAKVAYRAVQEWGRRAGKSQTSGILKTKGKEGDSPDPTLRTVIDVSSSQIRMPRPDSG